MRSTVLVLALAVLARVAGADDPRPPSADFHASVELVDKNGEPHAIVTSKLACSTPAKCPAWTLDSAAPRPCSCSRSSTCSASRRGCALPPSTSRRRWRWRRRRSCRPRSCAPASSTPPTRDGSAGPSSRSEGGKPKLVWRGEIGMTTAKGGGFATTDGVGLRRHRARQAARARVRSDLGAGAEQDAAPAEPAGAPQVCPQRWDVPAPVTINACRRSKTARA